MTAQRDVAQSESAKARLLALASRRAEEFIDEIPRTLRRLRTLLLVIGISVPVALAAAIFLLWRAVS